MRILLTGSSGFVGRRLEAALAADGHDIVVLRRGGPGGDGVFAAPANLADIETAADWPRGIDTAKSECTGAKDGGAESSVPRGTA